MTVSPVFHVKSLICLHDDGGLSCQFTVNFLGNGKEISVCKALYVTNTVCVFENHNFIGICQSIINNKNKAQEYYKDM